MSDDPFDYEAKMTLAALVRKGRKITPAIWREIFHDPTRPSRQVVDMKVPELPEGKLWRAHEVAIAWTPADEDDDFDNPTSGTVKVGPRGRDGTFSWTDPWFYTIGAVFTSRDRLRGAKSVAQVMLDFNTLVVRDGIDPQVAHLEFMKIDEYVGHISRDISGVSERLEQVKGGLGGAGPSVLWA